MSLQVFVLLSITGLGLAGVYFLIASGLSLIFGLMDVLNLAHGLFFTAGSYATWWVMTRLLVVESLMTRFLIAMIVAAGVGLAIGWVTERVFVRRFYGDHVTQILVTLGLALAGVALIGGWFSYDPRTFPLPELFGRVVVIAGARIPVSRLVILAVSAVLLVALLAFLRRTRHGLIIRAGVENREMVQALGIDVATSFTLVFAIGGMLAAIGGVLGAVFFAGITPDFGLNVLIFAFIVVVIGGLGSVEGTALSAVIVGLTQQFVNFLAGAGVGDLTVVVLLAATLLLRPQGLLGEVAR
jgi:branched-chain amino acid transport system permease protein